MKFTKYDKPCCYHAYGKYQNLDVSEDKYLAHAHSVS